MKQTKELMLYLIPILLIILTPYRAKASTVISANMPYSGNELDSNTTQVIQAGHRLDNAGKGKLYFTFIYWNKNGETYFNPIYAIMIQTGNAEYVCNLGNQITYNDEGAKKSMVVSAECPVNFTNTGYRAMKIIRGQSTPVTKIFWSYTMTFISEDTVDQSTQEQTTAINGAISSQTQQLLDRLYNNQIDNQNLTTRIVNNQNAIWQQQAQHWEAMENTDISNNAKQQPNQDNYDDVQDQEDEVYNSLDDIDINTLVDMNIDINTSNWIWNTITSILQANQRVMAMVISILSLGLCKFVLGR